MNIEKINSRAHAKLHHARGTRLLLINSAEWHEGSSRVWFIGKGGTSRRRAEKKRRGPGESIEEKARRVPLGSVPLGSRTRAENAHARSPFFLFKPGRPREPPFDVPSRPLRLHRLHCYTFSDVIRTSELGSGFDADVTLVNAISERLAEEKRREREKRKGRGE